MYIPNNNIVKSCVLDNIYNFDNRVLIFIWLSVLPAWHPLTEKKLPYFAASSSPVHNFSSV